MKAILTYHSVDETGSVISVSPAELERHVDALMSRGVKIVPLPSLRILPPDVDAVALTFDDGFANFASAAVPILIARSIPATIFVVPSYVGSVNSWEAMDSRSPVPQLPLMSWADIAQVRLQGFEIGGHGQSHRSLRLLERNALESEVNECAAVIKERVGADPVSFAFPYGDHDASSVETVSRKYTLACTTRFDFVKETDAQHSLPRLDAYYFRGGRMLARWGSPEFTAYVAARRVGRRLGSALRRSARGLDS